MFNKLSKGEKTRIRTIETLAKGARMHLEWGEMDVKSNGRIESYNESHHWYSVNIQKIKEIIDGEFEKSSLVPSQSKEYFLKCCLEAAGKFYGDDVPEFPKRNLDI